MKHTLLSAFENLPYFTIAGFRQIAGDDVASDEHARVALYRWVRSGYLVPLKKGMYMHRRFYERHGQEIDFSAMVSAILLPQSYLSLEYVLQQHAILTEIIYPVTAVTLKNTRTFTNSLGTFVYRHIRADYYQGFHITETHGMRYAQALPAKALFDYLYLRPTPGNLKAQTFDLAEDLRLNLDEFAPKERAEFAAYVAASGMVKMEQILHNLEFHVWRP